MGYMLHHTIVVTSHNDKLIQDAADQARKLGCAVLGPSAPLINGFASMMVCPDGSKEGWAESHRGDRQRAEFIAYLNSKRYDDGSTSLEWAEISYGSDDETAAVENHAWK